MARKSTAVGEPPLTTQANDSANPTGSKPKKRRGPGNRRPNAADHAAAADRAERRAKNVELRASGMTFDEVAKALGYGNKGDACKDFHRALRETPAASVAEYRAEDNAIIEAVLREHFEKVGDPGSAQVMLKAIEQRRKTNGYDVQKTELTVGDASPSEARRLIKERFRDVEPAGDAESGQ